MGETTFGIERSTLRSAGWIAAIGISLTLLVVEPWLVQRGRGALVVGIYGVLVPVLLVSIVEDVRAWREHRQRPD